MLQYYQYSFPHLVALHLGLCIASTLRLTTAPQWPKDAEGSGTSSGRAAEFIEFHGVAVTSMSDSDVPTSDSEDM